MPKTGFYLFHTLILSLVLRFTPVVVQAQSDWQPDTAAQQAAELITEHGLRSHE